MGVEAIVSKAKPSRVLEEGRLLSFACVYELGVENGLSRQCLAKNGEAKVQGVRLLYDWRGWSCPVISSMHVK